MLACPCYRRQAHVTRSTRTHHPSLATRSRPRVMRNPPSIPRASCTVHHPFPMNLRHLPSIATVPLPPHHPWAEPAATACPMHAPPVTPPHLACLAVAASRRGPQRLLPPNPAARHRIHCKHPLPLLHGIPTALPYSPPVVQPHPLNPLNPLLSLGAACRQPTALATHPVRRPSRAPPSRRRACCPSRRRACCP
jgi:hypothetical protein